MNNERPLQINACGHLMETGEHFNLSVSFLKNLTRASLTPQGVDESASVTMLYSGNRIAHISFSSACSKFAPTYIVGEKGCIQIPNHSWCPTELIVNGEKYTIPLPPVNTQFDNGIGIKFEVEAVRQAIASGLKQHPEVSHDHSRLIMDIVSSAVNRLGSCHEE